MPSATAHSWSLVLSERLDTDNQMDLDYAADNVVEVAEMKPAAPAENDSVEGRIIDYAVLTILKQLIPRMCEASHNYPLIIWMEAVVACDQNPNNYPLTTHNNSVIWGLIGSYCPHGHKAVGEALADHFNLKLTLVNTPEVVKTGVADPLAL
ncbi:hypothetical protein FRC12_004867 [Ceratobasidium sp. 428]|nr:hypothetical protein FRC12_004867 [Ceratobasidium sp. 428]